MLIHMCRNDLPRRNQFCNESQTTNILYGGSSSLIRDGVGSLVSNALIESGDIDVQIKLSLLNENAIKTPHLFNPKEQALHSMAGSSFYGGTQIFKDLSCFCEIPSLAERRLARDSWWRYRTCDVVHRRF